MSSAGRVLVIEDDDLLRDTLTEVLADEGHDVRGAGHGADALELLGAWQPELIILDLMMPVMDAFEFRDEQRRMGLALDTPVVVLSAARDLGSAAARVDAAAFLPKPFHLAEVLRLVDDILDAHRKAGPVA